MKSTERPAIFSHCQLIPFPVCASDRTSFATIARVREANCWVFLRHTPSSPRAIDFDPSVCARNIERNYDQFTMLPAPSPRAPRCPPTGPVIARRWTGLRIDCFGILSDIFERKQLTRRHASATRRGRAFAIVMIFHRKRPPLNAANHRSNMNQRFKKKRL